MPPERTWKPTAMATRIAAISSSRRSRPARRSARSDRSPRATRSTAVSVIPPLLAGRGRLVSADALAELVLLDPSGLHDDVEIVPRDRHRREEPRLQLDLLLAAVPLRGLLDGLAGGERDRGTRGLLPQLARVLPHRHRLRAERDTI